MTASLKWLPWRNACLAEMAVLAALLTQPGTDLRAGQATAGATSGVVFTDVTAAAGIRFKHNNGAFGRKYLPETLGSGAAFLDFDNDGWQDILLVNSKGSPALYRNNRTGSFTDVTKQAGLAVEMSGFGVAAADYDNDGRVDIYLTALGPDRLFRNVGGRKKTSRVAPG